MKKTQKLVALLLILAMALTLAVGCGNGGDGGSGTEPDENGSAKVYTWKIQCAYPPGDQAYDIHMPMICEAITKATDGQIQFEPYQPGAICEPAQAPASVAKGILECAISAPNDAAAIVPAAYAEQGVPFYWETAEDVFECFYDYGLLDFIREEYAKANIYYAMFDPNGSYNLMANFEINSGADLKGKKIRSSTSYATLMEIMGAAPVTMSGGDIYMGMKLGTIDGYIYSVAELEMSSLKEVTPNVMLPAACATAPTNLIIGMDAWNSLTPELQQIVNDTCEELFMQLFEASDKIDKEAQAAAEAYGVVYKEVPAEAMSDFYAASDQVLKQLSEKYPESAPGFQIISDWKAAKDAR